jgi:hypothetical protein
MRASIPVRLSDELREVVVSICPDNLSAGVRALIILAALHEGYDLAPLKPDIERLISEPLKPPIKQTMMHILMDTVPPPTPGQSPAAPPAALSPPPANGAEDDPFADVGEEV